MGEAIGQFRHSITHHRYLFTVSRASISGRLPANGAFRWFAPRELERVPLSTTARKALHLIAIL
jgi:adenine-specific DNA glycosylase